MIQEFNISHDWHFDLVASKSCTAPIIAKYRDSEILRSIHQMPDTAVICDGTACVGFDTISFSRHFNKVIAVENDLTRFKFLHDNLGVVDNVRIRFCNILDFIGSNPLFKTVNMLYLDPPWENIAPNTPSTYTASASLALSINDVGLDQCVKDAFTTNTSLQSVVLKLPNNFDKLQISLILLPESSNLSITLHHIRWYSKPKMFFAVIERNSDHVVKTQREFLTAPAQIHDLPRTKKRR